MGVNKDQIKHAPCLSAWDHDDLKFKSKLIH